MNRCALLVLAVMCGSLGCGRGSSGLKSGFGGTDGGSAAGGSTGSATDGGVGTGGTATGGARTTETGTGGKASGGTVGMDAAASGGRGSGGLATGGSTGAVATGGTGVGGTGTGGARTGGAGTGGTGTGGARTGGTGTGGKASGGTGGTVAGASLELDRSRMDFGSIALGTASVATFTLTNRGTSTSGVPFVIPEGGNITVTGCSAGLPPGASCLLTISVTPPELGLFDGFVRITADPGTKGTSSPYLSIYVVGWAIGFEVSSPSAVDLGNLAPGVPVKHIITITALITLSDLELWTGGEDVSIDSSASTCTATLAVGASCVVTVNFNASTVGWKRDMVGIRAGGDYGQIANVELTANVTKSSDLAIEPKTPQSFVGVFEKSSSPVVFTVTNLSNTTSGTIVSAIVGESARDFKISETDCTILAPHTTCTVSVVCSPPMSASAATRHAILSVTDGNTHLSVPLSAEVTFEL
jgi:hypothetical protein